jgi:hypothetical protein
MALQDVLLSSGSATFVREDPVLRALVSVALKSIIENHCESKVRYITKNDVALSLLRPPRKGKNEATMAIESADGIVEAMRTMTIAIAAQEKRLQDWKHAKTETLKKTGE